MAEIAKGALLYVRRWRLHVQALAAVLCGLLWLAVPQDKYDVPARDGVTGALWPLIPGLFAAVLPLAFGTAAGIAERLAPHPSRTRLLTVAAVLPPAIAMASCGAATDSTVAMRNTMLLTGLALCGSWLPPPGAAWGPAVLTPMVMWFVGTRPFGSVAPWAVLLLPGEVTYAWTAAVLVFFLGAIGYVWRGALWE
jgi:hypothetical protein